MDNTKIHNDPFTLTETKCEIKWTLIDHLPLQRAIRRSRSNVRVALAWVWIGRCSRRRRVYACKRQVGAIEAPEVPLMMELSTRVGRGIVTWTSVGEIEAK